MTHDEARAIRIGRLLLELAQELGIGTGTTAPAVWTQDSLPPDATSRDAYLRRHRRHMKAGTPGWSCSGQTRSVAVEAWRADVAGETARARARRPAASPAPAANDIHDQLDRAFGIKTRRTG